jgi:hypothetical protein
MGIEPRCSDAIDAWRVTLGKSLYFDCEVEHRIVKKNKTIKSEVGIIGLLIN